MSSGETLLLSDLHLSPETPETTALLLALLAGRARAARQVLILGDLFDAWIGDDDDTPPYPAVRAALAGLTRAGTDCGFLPGNRDFLIGRRFLRETGCTRLRDPSLIRLAGEPVLLMHGDLLCTADAAYRRFRRRVRNPLVKQLFLWKPLAARRALAARYRAGSRAATAGQPPERLDADPAAAAALMRRFGTRHLIHGHTHRPGEHVFDLDGQPARRSVLADWGPERGELLVHGPSGWHRELVPGAKPPPAAAARDAASA